MRESAPGSGGFLRPGALTRRRAAIVAAAGYIVAALVVRISLSVAEVFRGRDDLRDQQVTQAFLFVMLIFFTSTLVTIYRRPKLSKP